MIMMTLTIMTVIPVVPSENTDVGNSDDCGDDDAADDEN